MGLYLCVYTDPGWQGDQYEGTFPGETRIGIYEASSVEAAKRKMLRALRPDRAFRFDYERRIEATPVNGKPLMLRCK